MSHFEHARYIDLLSLLTNRKATRIEVIDSQNGRVYSKWDMTDLNASVQDEGKTIKLFVERKQRQEH